MTQSDFTRVRIVATSDSHGKMLPYHYAQNKDAVQRGFTRTASLIKQARSENDLTLLVDNGDTWQGSAFVQSVAGKDAVTDAFNALGYDAVGLGNHDFGDGLPALKRQIDRLKCPVLCANLQSKSDDIGAKDYSIKVFSTDIGVSIRVGIFALSPPQVMQWDHQRLHGKISMSDMTGRATTMCNNLRNRVDILVCLAHTGLSKFGAADRENVGHELLHLPLDALVLGHTHEVMSDVINGTAVVQPGFDGGHIGVLDIDLTQTRDRWTVSRRVAETRAIFKTTAQNAAVPSIGNDPVVSKIVDPRHKELLLKTERPVATTKNRVESFFATVAPSSCTSLVAKAIKSHVPSDQLKKSDQMLPLLVSAATYKCGGASGVTNYTDLPAGPVTQFGVDTIYPFADTLTVLRITGAELIEWLERGVSGFNKIVTGQRDVPLINDGWASYDFEGIFGLRYKVDLSKPSRYNKIGQCIDSSSRRVCDLSFDGAAISSKDQFLVATNSYRAFGGGHFPGARAANVILETDIQISHAVTQFLRSKADWDRMQSAFVFSRMANTTVVFNSSPKGYGCMPSDRFEYLGNTQGDWGTYRITL